MGGVTLELLIDNPKALVIENNPKSEDEIKYNAQALLLATNLGTELSACNCYWPRTKGKVEKPYQNDSYIHIGTNKYSVPVKYAAKQLQYRIVYGFRIELYTMESEYIMSSEVLDGKHGTFKDAEHYEAIAVKTSKSIPQIKIDFTRAFKNGEAYLKAEAGVFSNPAIMPEKYWDC